MCLDWVSNLSSTNNDDKGGVPISSPPWVVIRGLDPRIQGRRPQDMTEGAAWLPGSGPGMTGG
jgi:hypothetical protein